MRLHRERCFRDWCSFVHRDCLKPRCDGLGRLLLSCEVDDLDPAPSFPEFKPVTSGVGGGALRTREQRVLLGLWRACSEVRAGFAARVEVVTEWEGLGLKSKSRQRLL